MQTILIVDDSSTIRQVIVFCLKEAGYQIIEAVDGKDAMEKLANNRVDLLLTDLHMPRMNGFELAREVRASGRHRFIPILVLTTEAQQASKDEGKSIGVTGWFVKPFEPDQLIKVVKKVLPAK